MKPKLSQDERDVIESLVLGFVKRNPDIDTNDIPNFKVFADLYDEENRCPSAFTGESNGFPVVVVSFKNHWGCHPSNGLFDWPLWQDYSLAEIY